MTWYLGTPTHIVGLAYEVGPGSVLLTLVTLDLQGDNDREQVIKQTWEGRRVLRMRVAA